MLLETLLVLIIVGAIAGFTARSLVPGPDPMGTIGTIGLGILGAFLGSYLMRVLFSTATNPQALSVPNIVGAVLGAIVVLLVFRLALSGGRGGWYGRRRGYGRR